MLALAQCDCEIDHVTLRTANVQRIADKQNAKAIVELQHGRIIVNSPYWLSQGAKPWCGERGCVHSLGDPGATARPSIGRCRIGGSVFRSRPRSRSQLLPLLVDSVNGGAGRLAMHPSSSLPT